MSRRNRLLVQQSATWILVKPKAEAFCAPSVRARSLTSTAQTLAPGESIAIDSAIGAQPQPRSSGFSAGAVSGVLRSSTSVSLTTPAGEKMPAAVFNVTGGEARSTATGRVSKGLLGGAK